MTRNLVKATGITAATYYPKISQGGSDKISLSFGKFYSSPSFPGQSSYVSLRLISDLYFLRETVWLNSANYSAKFSRGPHDTSASPIKIVILTTLYFST